MQRSLILADSALWAGHSFCIVSVISVVCHRLQDKLMSFPDGSVVKNPSAAHGTPDPRRRAWQPTPAFSPGKSQGQGSLAGYSLWGCKRVRHELATKQKKQHQELKTLISLLPSHLLCLLSLMGFSGARKMLQSKTWFRRTESRVWLSGWWWWFCFEFAGNILLFCISTLQSH